MTKIRPAARRAAAVAGGLLLTCSLGACSVGSGTQTAADAASLPRAPASQQLGSACGRDIVVQLQWQPQADMGALFSLLGPDYQVDTTRHSVTGTLVVNGKSTGTKLTLRSGGASVGFQSVTSEMYGDNSIDLGLVHEDQMITASGNQPVVGVTPLLTHSPTILLWDPASYGRNFSLAKLAGSGATVLTSKDQAFTAWLLAKGLIKKTQLDTSYDGSPARFVSDPKIVQQGFADAEPYVFEHETPAWGKPVSYELLEKAGYDPYESNLVVRANRLQSYSACLKKLVPIVQRATADYITHPAAANNLIVKIVAADPSDQTYSLGEANYASTELLKDHLIEPEDGTVGGYDMKRVSSFIGEVAPVLRAQGDDVASNLTARDLFTTRFTDHSVTLP